MFAQLQEGVGARYAKSRHLRYDAQFHMGTGPNYLACDGCGLPASPEHIAERVRRLELATRYRPIHISVLFVALAPPDRMEEDFYAPPDSGEFFESLLAGLDIPSSSEATKGTDAQAISAARLAEFQHKGYYLTYVSECPRRVPAESPATTISRLGPTLVRRIRFNYRPKFVAPLSEELAPLLDVLRGAGTGQILTLDHGTPLSVPRTVDRQWLNLFQKAMAIAATAR